MQLATPPFCKGPNLASALHVYGLRYQWTTSLWKGRPRCYTKSPTVQDGFQPIPGLIIKLCWGNWEMMTAVVSQAQCSSYSGVTNHSAVTGTVDIRKHCFTRFCKFLCFTPFLLCRRGHESYSLQIYSSYSCDHHYTTVFLPPLRVLRNLWEVLPPSKRVQI